MAQKEQTLGHDLNDSFNIDGDLRPSLDDEIDAINSNIIRIIETDVGTRLNRRLIGSNFKRLLFKPLNVDTAEEMLDNLEQILNLYEPRIQFLANDSRVIVDLKKRAYELTIKYKVIKTNQLQTFPVEISVGDSN